MLMKCPECELQVSDKALVCPHCGYPISQPHKIERRNITKRKRLPNGFGQISEIKNANLRNRFRAMITVGKNEYGRPIVKPLKPVSYFSTYNNAYAALLEYNKNPYDLNDCITMEELYNRWSESYFKTLKSISSQRTVTAAWAYCSSIYKMNVLEIRARHLKNLIDNAFVVVKGEKKLASPNIKSRIKSIFNLMFDYAVEYDLVTKNYARSFNLSDDVVEEAEKVKRGHIPFSDTELDTLWNNREKYNIIDVMLFQCYGGWRPQEIGLIELSNVHLDEGYIIGGMKTDFGTNRIVPIHEKIKDIVQRNYETGMKEGRKYLFACEDGKAHKSNAQLTYDKYQSRFEQVRDVLKLKEDHRPHDGRVTFVTNAKKCNLDEYAIKYIVGHKIEDLTERTYTKREIDWLIAEMQKLK